MRKSMTQDEMMELLDRLYEQSIRGIPMVSVPVEELVQEYVGQNQEVSKAAKSFIRYQIAKCTTSGFLAGLGGLVTVPVAIPANIGSVLYVQMRMIAVLANMGGYDTDSDQVRTLVYACLAGVSVEYLLKKAGIKLRNKFALNAVKKIPEEVLIKINQKVGFRLLTRFGTKGVVNLGKAVPVVGGMIGGGFDFAETKAIASRAYSLFLEGDEAAYERKIRKEA